MQANIPNLSLPINFAATVPREKSSAAWAPHDKMSLLTMAASGMKAEAIMPHFPGRTKSAIQGIISRKLPAFKAQQVAQQHAFINNMQPMLPQLPQPATTGDRGVS